MSYFKRARTPAERPRDANDRSHRRHLKSPTLQPTLSLRLYSSLPLAPFPSSLGELLQFSLCRGTLTSTARLRFRLSAVLAAFFLDEQLGRVGVSGCSLCLVGSIIIILHAPEDVPIGTVDEVLDDVLQPGPPVSHTS